MRAAFLPNSSRVCWTHRAPWGEHTGNCLSGWKELLFFRGRREEKSDRPWPEPIAGVCRPNVRWAGWDRGDVGPERDWSRSVRWGWKGLGQTLLKHRQLTGWEERQGSDITYLRETGNLGYQGYLPLASWAVDNACNNLKIWWSFSWTPLK